MSRSARIYNKHTKEVRQVLEDIMKTKGLDYGSKVKYDYIDLDGVYQFEGIITKRDGIPIVEITGGDTEQLSGVYLKFHSKWQPIDEYYSIVGSVDTWQAVPYKQDYNFGNPEDMLKHKKARKPSRLKQAGLAIKNAEEESEEDDKSKDKKKNESKHYFKEILLEAKMNCKRRQ